MSIPTTTRLSALVGLGLGLGLALTLPACGPNNPSDSGTSSASDPWIDGEIPDTGGQPPGPGGGGDDEDEDESEGGEEDELLWEVFGEFEPGVSFTGEGEVIHIAGGEVLCAVFHQAVSVQPLDDCTECEFAFELEYTGVEVEVDTDCPVDAASIEGRRERVGYSSPETLWVDDGSGWREAGWAGVEGSEFFFEYELE